MARIKYYYDTETCKYERIKTRTSDIIVNFLGFMVLSIGFGAGIYFLFNTYFESPKELMLRNEVKQMTYFYENIQKEVQEVDKVAEMLAYRDNNIYRVIMGAEPITSTIRNAGVGGTDRYRDIKDEDFEYKEYVLTTKQKVDRVKRKLFIQQQSHEELEDLIENKEKLLAAIPAIQPVSNKELIRLASGYGMRYHPIYNMRKMHAGIDFSAPIGTPIYATADGKITLVKVSFRGYGKEIEIDHGFGFITKYAHMHDFNVKKGQMVKRGELIGYVGNTGLSTAPHLHYEVHRNGKKVNPVHYFFNDLSAEEYEKVIELASMENQSLGM
ncbi:MAG: M23 family metallopeptidase [Cyclobacteriaceae bacterium]|nr:M23 family metallopeptidase [Cyclobacteriaceae bacterium]